MGRTGIVFLAGLVLCGLWAGWLLGGVLTGTDTILADPDAHLHAWNLWWVQKSLVDLGHSPYWTRFNGYPHRINLTYHQLILPLGLLSIPLFQLGLHAGQALAFWQILLPLIGYAGGFVLLKRLGGSDTGALLAGLYLVMVPIGWENLARPDSLSYLLMPWLFLAVIDGCRGRWVRLLPAVLLVGILALMSPYYGSGLGLMWLLTLPFAPRLNLDRGRLALIYPLGLLVASFEWVPQLLGEGPNLVEPRIVEAFSADLTGWFLPHPHLLWVPEELAGWASSWTAGIHSSLYPGWLGLGAALLGMLRLDSRYRRWAGLVGGTFFLISLGPGVRILGETYLSGWLPYGWAMSLLDQARAFRIPLRFGYFVILLLGLGIGIWARDRRWHGMIGAFILLELVRPPMRATPLPDPAELRRVRAEIRTPALVPVPLTDWATEAQFGQTIHGKKFPLTGISYTPRVVWSTIGSHPPLEALFNRKRDLPEQGWSELRESGMGGVILHHRVLPDRLARSWRRQLRDRLGPPVVVGNRFLCYRIDADS